MTRETFSDVPRTRFHTSAGDVELPFPVRDGSALFSFFRVDPARVAAVLAGTPLLPARFAGGSGLAGIAICDYRDTGIGPYREALVVVAVVPEGTRAPALPLLGLLRAGARHDVGFHVVDLPVTSALADAAGRELWGFPKFTTDIDLEVRPHVVRGVVGAPTGEEPILTVEGLPGLGLPLPAMDLVLYPVLAGRLLRTVVNARGRMHTSLGRAVTVRVGLGSHPMADRLAALGLADAHPIAVQVCTHYEAMLHAGEPLATARAA